MHFDNGFIFYVWAFVYIYLRFVFCCVIGYASPADFNLLVIDDGKLNVRKRNNNQCTNVLLYYNNKKNIISDKKKLGYTDKLN